MNFFLKITKRDAILTHGNKEIFRNRNLCRFCEKIEILMKLKIIVIYQAKQMSRTLKMFCKDKQKESKFTPFSLQKFQKFWLSTILQKVYWYEKKWIKIRCYSADEQRIKISNMLLFSIHWWYRFLSSSLDSLVKKLLGDNHKRLEIFFKKKWLKTTTIYWILLIK